jgi:hypothetical protein
MSSYKDIRLMVFNEIIAVCCEKHTKQTQCVGKAQFSNVDETQAYSN